MADEARQMHTLPLLVVPAQHNGGEDTLTNAGRKAVMFQMTNAVVHCNFPMDLDQARQTVENIQRAILEAENLHIPNPRKLERLQ